MNIVFLSPLPPHPGGISEFSYYLLKALSKVHKIKIIKLKIFPNFLLRKLGFFDKFYRSDFKKLSFYKYEVFNLYNPFEYFKHSYFTKKFSHIIIPYWNAIYFPIYLPLMFNKFFFNKQILVLILHNVEDHNDFLLKRLIRRFIFSFFDKFVVHSFSEKIKLIKIYNIHENRIVQLQHPLYSFND